MKKRLLAILCVLALSLGLLAACNSGEPATSPPASSQPAPSQSAPPPPPSENPPPPANGDSAQQPPAGGDTAELPGGFKIGLHVYTNAGLWWDRLYDAFNATAAEFGCSVVIHDGGTPPEAIAAIENLCAAGVDAIATGATGGVSARLMEICAENGVYMAAFYNDLSIDPGYEGYSKNPYFAGDVYADEYATSYAIAKDMIADGGTDFVIFGLPPGVSTSFDLRASGAIDAVKDAGLPDAVEVRSFALPEIANTFIQQYPNTNAVYSIICSTTYITNPMMAAGWANKVQVMTYDDEGESVAAFNAGLLTHASEGVNAMGQMAFVLLYNALTGNRMQQADGTAAHVLLPYCYLRSADEFQVFLNASTGGNYPYTMAEIKDMIVLVNPGASLDGIKALAGQFSIDWLKTR